MPRQVGPFGLLNTYVPKNHDTEIGCLQAYVSRQITLCDTINFRPFLPSALTKGENYPQQRGFLKAEMEKIASRHNVIADRTPNEHAILGDEGLESEGLPGSDNAKGGLQRAVTAQDWNGPDDPENPHNWPLWQRVYHTYVFPGILSSRYIVGENF